MPDRPAESFLYSFVPAVDREHDRIGALHLGEPHVGGLRREAAMEGQGDALGSIHLRAGLSRDAAQVDVDLLANGEVTVH